MALLGNNAVPLESSLLVQDRLEIPMKVTVTKEETEWFDNQGK